jgi:hypothetical protein
LRIRVGDGVLDGYTSQLNALVSLGLAGLERLFRMLYNTATTIFLPAVVQLVALANCYNNIGIYNNEAMQ